MKKGLRTAALVLLAACGSSSTSTTAAPDGGTPGFEGGSREPTPPPSPAPVPPPPPVDGGSDVEVDAGPLLAPTFETLKSIDGGAGGLVITWTNNQLDCDNVLGERKDALDPYAQIVVAAGTDTKATDLTATANINYTYRLRCKKGSAYSPYSFELSANPTQP